MPEGLALSRDALLCRAGNAAEQQLPGLVPCWKGALPLPLWGAERRGPAHTL